MAPGLLHCISSHLTRNVRTIYHGAFNGRTRLKSVSYRGNGTDGYIKFRDGGSSGSVLCELDVGTSDTFTIYVLLPGEGIVFQTSIYVDLSNVSATTVFYG
jgi:hypothetical protein